MGSASSRFIRALARVCRRLVLQEKWLIAPARSTANQWKSGVARLGTPVVNLQPSTLWHLAALVAGAGLIDEQLSIVPFAVRRLIVQQLLSRCRADDRRGFFSRINPPDRAASALLRLVDELGSAGLSPDDLALIEDDAAGEKAGLSLFYRRYLERLSAGGWVDYPGLLRRAICCLRGGKSPLARDAVIIVPADICPGHLEKLFLDAFPSGRLLLLPVDASRGPVFHCGADLSLRVAAGEVNEVRAVFRSIVEEGLPLDECELLYTNRDTYVPLILEEERRLFSEDSACRITFAQGVPGRVTRPGRALRAWMSLARNNCDQKTMRALFRDRLVSLDGRDEPDTDFDRFAECFGSLPIVAGKERYLPVFSRALAGLENDADPQSRRQLALFEKYRPLVDGIVRGLPLPDAEAASILEGARVFIEAFARCVSDYDFAACREFTASIEMILPFITDCDDCDFDAWLWLEHLLASVNILRRAPRPGALHVDSVDRGGHSGRFNTFILGLDEGRYPGLPVQGPLLSDSEKELLSGHLVSAKQRLAGRIDGFRRLLARLRGRVSLLYSCMDSSDGRRRFPSRLLAAVDCDSAFPVLSHVPFRASACTSDAEWWLCRLSGRVLDDRDGFLSTFAPAPARGRQAIAARMSDAFTCYDGFVGTRVRAGKTVFSPGALERLAACPLSWFFRDLLKVAPSPQAETDISRWLSRAEIGLLLHRAFRRFFRGPCDWPVVYEEQYDRLAAIVDDLVEEYRQEKPPLSDFAFFDQYRRIHHAARIFLREEETLGAGYRPMFFEVSVGTRPEAGGSVLDIEKPLEVVLPSGRVLRLGGRIDRVDAIVDGTGDGYAVWDYKTGRGRRYLKSDPFRGGRVMQHFLYTLMAESRLKAVVSHSASVVQAGYIQPGVESAGSRVSYPVEELEGGFWILDELLSLVETGVFPASTTVEDCRYCDYVDVCAPVEQLSRRSLAKVSDKANDVLGPFRKLRGVEQN